MPSGSLKNTNDPQGKTWTSPRPKRVSLDLWVYRHRIPILSAAGALVLVILGVVGYSTSVVVNRFEGRRWNLSSRIYSDLLALKPGDGSTPEKLTAKLDRLLYQRDSERPSRPS